VKQFSIPRSVLIAEILLHWKLGNNQSISIAGKLTTGATYTTGNYKITFEEVLCGGATGSDRVRMHNRK
jgi:hypothetical protein